MTAAPGRTRGRASLVLLLCIALVIPPGPVFEGASLPRLSVPAFLRLPHLDLRVPNPLAVVAAAWNGLADAAAWTWDAITEPPSAHADDPPAFGAGAVTTLAGDGTKADVDGTLPAQVAGANGVAATATKVWVATDHRLRVIDRATGTISTFAGGGTAGCTNSSDPALVRFNGDERLTTDGTDVYTVSQTCGAIRRTTPSGVTTAVATAAFRDATHAPDGYLYATASTNNDVRLLRVNKSTGATTILATFGSSTGAPTAVAADAGAVYFVHANSIKKYALPSGPVSTLRTSDTAIGTNTLVSVGSYLVGDGGSARSLVRRYDKTTGEAHVVAGSFSAMFVDGTGADAGFGSVRDIASDGTTLFVADDTNNRVRQITDTAPLSTSVPPTPPATHAGSVTTMTTTPALTSLRGIVWAGDRLWVSGEQRLRSVDPTNGILTTVAGLGGSAACTDGVGAAARFNGDEELASDGHAVYSASSVCGRIRRTAPNGATSTLHVVGNARSIAVGPDGLVYFTGTTSSGGFLYRIHPTNGDVMQLANVGLQAVPEGVAVDGTAAYVSMTPGSGGRAIVRVDLATLQQTTFANDSEIGRATLESAGPFLYGGAGQYNSGVRRYDKGTAAHLIVAGTVAQSFADGTAADAGLGDVTDLTSDGTALYVADGGNNRIRKIVPGTAFTLASYQPAPPIDTAVVTTVPTLAALGAPSGVAVHGDGMFVMSGTRLVKVAMAAGTQSTVAGATTAGCIDGDAATARFAGDEELVTDGYAIYSASDQCARVRRTAPNGHTVTLFTLSDANGIALGADGLIYTVGTTSFRGALWRTHPTNGGAHLVAHLGTYDALGALAVDATAAFATGRVLSNGSRSLWRIDLATGAITTLRNDLTGSFQFGIATLHDGGDTVYADGVQGHSVVRLSKVDGVVAPVAGSSSPAYLDGIGTAARFNTVTDLTSDGVYLYAADRGNGVIRALFDDRFLFPGAEVLGDDPYTGWRADVNPALRSYELVAEDLSIGTPGPALALTRTYNSMDLRHSPFGLGWTFDYDMQWRRADNGDVILLHPDGRRETHVRQSDGSFVGPIGHFSTLVASGGGYTLTTRGRTSYTFGSSGRLTSITDSNGRTVSLAYNATGRLQSATAAGGRSITFGWSGHHIVSAMTDYVAEHGRRLEWRYYYDGGRLVRACDPIDNSATGRCTVYGYANGLLTTVTRPKGNAVTSVTYDANGKVSSRGDAYGHETTFTVISPGIVDVTDPRGKVTRQSYDALYRLVSERDPGNRITTYEYDARGVRYRVTNPENETTVTNTDARGNVTSMTNAEGETTWTEYDLLDRVTAVRDGRSSSATDETYAVHYGYDAAGNRTSETAPPTAEYPNGRSRSWTYSDGTEWSYDGGAKIPPGLLLTATDFRGNVTTYKYNEYGDLREVLDPEGLREVHTYDGLGRFVSTMEYSDSFISGADVRGVAYDELGRVTGEAGPTTINEIAWVVHYMSRANEYDQNGNLVSTVVPDDTPDGDPARETTFTYDDLDRVATVTDGEGNVTTYTYDAAGNVATVTNPEGRVRQSSYDDRNLVTHVDLLDYENPVVSGTPRDIPVVRRAYDAAGRLETETDPLGRVRRRTYDDAGRLTTLTIEDYVDRDGSVRDIVIEATEYDAAGSVTRSEKGNGRLAVATTYDAAGWRTSSTVDPTSAQTPNALNRVTTWAHDRDGNTVTETRTGGGRTEQTRTTYDAMSRPLSVTVENGATDLTTTYSYDDRGMTIATTDPRGNLPGATATDFTTYMRYDVARRLVEAKGPPVAVETASGVSVTRPVTKVGYNAFGQVDRTSDARGVVMATFHDRNGRAVRVTYPSYTRPGGGTLTPTELFQYDGVGNVLAHTDRSGRVTDMQYDDLDRRVRSTDPLVTGAAARGILTTTYDDAGNVTRVVNQRGDVTDRTYDALNRVRTETGWSDPSTSHTTTFDYDDAGNPTYEQRPGLRPSTASHSPVGELLTSTDALGEITRYEYDLASRPTLVRDALQRAEKRTYDLAGRLDKVERLSPADVVLTTELHGYDAAGNRTTSTSARGFPTTFGYDAGNRLTEVVRPVDALRSITTTYGYDAAASLVRVTNGTGAVTKYTYNKWGLLESTIEPATPAHPALADRTFTTTYDKAGRPVQESQPGGVVIARTFDELGRMTSETGSGPGVATASRSFGYDLAGLRTSFGHPSGTVSLTFDGRKLLARASGPAGTATFGRDSAGRVASRVDAAGTSTFSWNDRDDLQSVTDGISATVRVHTWDDARQLRAVSYRDASAPTVETSHRALEYDDLGRLKEDELTSSGVTTAIHQWTYDDDGNVASQHVAYGASTVATNFSYDRTGRLIEAEQTAPTPATTAYGWDDADNRVLAGASAFTYDERNRMLTDPAADYAYTARGVVASVTPNGGLPTVYDFDGLGRLRGVDGVVSSTYDALDRLATSGPATFSYVGAELGPVSDGTWRYGRSPSGGLLSLADSTTSSLVGQNRHGDVAYTFSSLGAVSGGRVFGPFGDVVASTGAVDGALGFQGGYTNPATGDVAMTTRWYRPGIGAFLSRDTVLGAPSDPVTLNRYLYGNANPLRFYDPDGRAALNTDTAMSMEEYRSETRRWARMEAEARAIGIPVKLDGRDRPWFGPGSLRTELAVARLNHKCSCDFHAQPLHVGDSWYSYAGKVAHQYSVGFVNGVTSTLSLGWAPEIEAVHGDDARLRRAEKHGKVAGVVTTVAASVAVGASPALASRVPAVARARAAYGGLSTSHKVAYGAASGALFGSATKDSTSGSVALSTLLGGAAPVVGPAAAKFSSKLGSALRSAFGPRTGTRATRVFTSSDPHVAEAANAVEQAMPGRVRDVNNNIQMTDGNFREVDIDLGAVVIQVKGGKAGHLVGQLGATERTTGRIAVGFAPDILDRAWDSAARDGIPIARNIDELLAIVKELG